MNSPKNSTSGLAFCSTSDIDNAIWHIAQVTREAVQVSASIPASFHARQPTLLRKVWDWFTQ